MASQPNSAKHQNPGWLGDFLAFLVFGALLLPLLWELSCAIDEPWAYTVRGVALMLWPCQWAYWLGRWSVSVLPNAEISHAPSADKTQ